MLTDRLINFIRAAGDLVTWVAGTAIVHLSPVALIIAGVVLLFSGSVLGFIVGIAAIALGVAAWRRFRPVQNSVRKS